MYSMDSDQQENSVDHSRQLELLKSDDSSEDQPESVQESPAPDD